ncbi:MAG: GNAT family N-acetyltransferase [Chloroflexi bacterium]|nr:MAG: GNAT family N-acetyltransferase [Chloroflexota bacterium]TME17441.1 MAG: GNAT family N-acetyltransferase [Chloroflexota bacterium]TME19627.1 MAG: GNAT family N-acetyltransferase [Chloroflexota bacterium]
MGGVRAASVRDLARIEEIQREGGGELSETAARGPVRLWSLLSQTISSILPAMYNDTLLYVAEEEGEVIGFIQAANRPAGVGLAGATTLQVLNLCVDPRFATEEVGLALIEHLSNQALQRGVHRLFVRLPLEDRLTRVFRMQAFRQYAIEYVLYNESATATKAPEPVGLRPEKRGDFARLYQLYRKVTPPGVAQVEAPTSREWKALRAEWFGHGTARGQTDQQFVVDRVELVGWMRVQRSSSTRPHSLSFMALPEEPLPHEMVDYSLSLLGSRPGTVWSSLRHYDSHMIEALRARGFSTLVTQSLMMRELALRAPVKEKAKGLVPSFG